MATWTVATPSPIQKQESRAGKYLVFQLGKEQFGIEVLRVREIMGIQTITPVPHTPEYVKGVINLRGKVIPVVDLRLKLSMEAVEYTQRTCIIVVHLNGSSGSIPMGIVVDGVAEVLNVSSGDIEAPPAFGDGITTMYLHGIAKVKDEVKMLLDIDKVIDVSEIGDTLLVN